MKKGERTRERIIRQAAPLFNQRGYEGSSMNEIMAATATGERRHLSPLCQQTGTGRRGFRLCLGRGHESPAARYR